MFNSDVSNLPRQTELKHHLLQTSMWKNDHLKNPLENMKPNDYRWSESHNIIDFKYFEGDQEPHSYGRFEGYPESQI